MSVYELPTSAHNEQLPDDELTTLTLNYQWRQFVAIAVYSELRRQLKSDVESEQIQLEEWINALMTDIYNGEIVDGTPVGAVTWFPLEVSSIPAKWIQCDGSVISSTVYPALCGVLPLSMRLTSTTWQLPDLRSRFLHGAAVDADVGDVGGQSSVALTIAEIPAHTHTIPRSTTAGAGNNVATGNNAGATSAINTGSQGTGAAHDNMPPYIRGFWLIKALP